MSRSEFFQKGTLDTKDKLFISFGGMYSLGDIPPFEFLNTLSEYSPEYDKYFYTDSRKAWYNRGIESISTTVEKTVEYLKEKISPYKQVIFIGSSAGGYAAILYGSILKIDHVIAFYPQTEISNFCLNCKDETYFDVKPFLNDKTKYTLYGSNLFQGYHSIVQCERICDKQNIELIYCDSLDLKEFRNNGSLKTMLLSPLNKYEKEKI
jgi:hypothetical protein